MKKIITIIISMVMALSFSVSTFANQNESMVNTGVINVGDVIIDIPFDSNGEPMITSGEVPMVTASEGAAVVITWELQEFTEDEYEMYYTASCTTGNDTIKVVSVGELIAKNASVFGDTYYEGNVYDIYSTPYITQTAFVDTFVVTDSPRSIKLTSKNVKVLLTSNGWLSLTNGSGTY